MTSGQLAAALAPIVSAFHPGTRLRPATVAGSARRSGVVAGEVADNLLEPGQLASLVQTETALASLAFVTPDGRVLRRRFRPEERPRAYLDCNNLAWSAAPPPPHEESVVAALRACLESLGVLGVTHTIVVADSSIGRVLGDSGTAAVASACDSFLIAPRDSSADAEICRLVENLPGMIVTNDRMRDWRRSTAWLRRNLWRLLVPVKFRPYPDYSDVEEELRSAVPSGRS